MIMGLKLNIFSRRWKRKKHAVLIGECLYCGACIGVCPQDNLVILGSGSGSGSGNGDEKLIIGENCIGCGDCEKICPVEAIRLERFK